MPYYYGNLRIISHFHWCKRRAKCKMYHFRSTKSVADHTKILAILLGLFFAFSWNQQHIQTKCECVRQSGDGRNGRTSRKRREKPNKIAFDSDDVGSAGCSVHLFTVYTILHRDEKKKKRHNASKFRNRCTTDAIETAYRKLLFTLSRRTGEFYLRLHLFIIPMWNVRQCHFRLAGFSHTLCRKMLLLTM